MKNTLTPRSPLKTGKPTVNQTPSGALDEVKPAKEPDLVSKFMRDNPKGTLQDPVEERGDFVQEPLGLEETPVEPTVETPVAETPPTEVPEAPIAEPQTQPEPIAAEPQAAKPAEPVAPVSEPAAVVPTVEPKISYEPGEKIHLLEGSEPWTREQVISGLQERATLEPKAQERDHLLQVLNQPDVASVERTWKPIIEALQADPMRGTVADIVIKADPGLLDYLQRSAQFYNELPADQKAAPAAQPQQPPADPRIDRMEKLFEMQTRQAIQTRAHTEWETVYQKYPSLRHNEKVRQVLYNAAGQLFTADERGGKSPLECRGLLDAMNDLAPVLEAAEIVAQRAATPVQQAAPPAIEPQPGRGAEALLGSNGPGPSGARSSTPTTPYKGNDPVAAFMRDHG